MQILTESLHMTTRGYGDMKDITGQVAELVTDHGLKDGTVTVFVPGATGGVTTIEYEGGLVEDFAELMERLAPSRVPYHHDKRWGDGNGFSHIRASLLGPSLTVPFSQGRLTLGTWQQIVFVDFDNRSRSRQLVVQIMGE
jgi:secondary thiamine-phosphate synthase enzyme